MLRFALPMNMRRLTIPVVKVLFIAGTAGLVSLLTFYISVRSLIFGNEVKVPDLHGHDVVASRRVLTASGLSLVIAGEEYDPVVPAGEVIRQTPPSGASIKTKRKIKVVVSRGTEVLAAPDLAGEGERKALLEIDRLGLRLGAVARVSAADRAADRVIGQTPLPDSPIFRGDRLSLLISRGPREPVYVMPDLAGQPLERARRALGSRGLNLGTARTEASNAPDGTILRQFPLPGYPVSRRDPISVVVSRSPLV
ncbi:MAG: PASTA domain-containing protein [Acidobacteria bacterium]|nr:PASTA domain-containing protein [Acidobacteriota bacterium]